MLLKGHCTRYTTRSDGLWRCKPRSIHWIWGLSFELVCRIFRVRFIRYILGIQFLCNKHLIVYVVATKPGFIYMYAGDSEGGGSLGRFGLDYELDFDTASIPPSLPDVTHVKSTPLHTCCLLFMTFIPKCLQLLLKPMITLCLKDVFEIFIFFT